MGLTADKGKLRYSFTWPAYGRLHEYTGLPDTPQNRKECKRFLVGVEARIAAGSYTASDYARDFPTGSLVKKGKIRREEFAAVGSSAPVSVAGRAMGNGPDEVLFSDFVDLWRKNYLSKVESPTKQDDFECALESWLLPFFGGMTFQEIGPIEVREFLMGMKRKDGTKLSRSRVCNIMIPLRAIYNDACLQYRWFHLPDAFKFAKRDYPKDKKKHPPGLRFAQWTAILENLSPYYVPHAEIQIMTGMIASELAGFRRGDIVDGEMLVRNSIVRRLKTAGGRFVEKSSLKTEYRARAIPVTAAIQERLDWLADRTDGEYLFMTSTGRHFNPASFRDVWENALIKAKVPYRNPYCLRHTFAAWALTIGIEPTRLVSLMGHGSKQMVYEVYGGYIKGVEEDAEQIRAYYGADFR